MLSPSKEEFLDRATEGRPIPVVRDVLGDIETPVAAYWKLAHDETYSFLLESVTGGERLARYSILGVRPKTVLRTRGRSVRRVTGRDESRSELAEGQDPLDLLKDALGPQVTHDASNLPGFIGGAVGMMAYDLVRFFERLPDNTEDDLSIDDMAMMVADAVVVFDHARNLIRIIVLAEPTANGYDRAVAEIERIVTRLRRPLPTLPAARGDRGKVLSNMTPDDYKQAVRRTVDYIAEGDGVQMVISQRFSTSVRAHPLTIYRALRSLNPSPYMFLLRFGDFDVIGASPEALVTLTDQRARVRPIAGTRPRGETPQQDAALAAELLSDEKERAEHIMLVDLGRNDLGRVCEYGSVKVEELMEVELYSHVMHIVSEVTGTLRADLDAFDLVRATFPAGTVSGAPKVRAMEIIDELEPTRRGLYAGAVGYFSASGDMDTCIAIRTILLQGERAYVQAGAGIVYDSVPERELEETERKASACLRAIDLAQYGLDV